MTVKTEVIPFIPKQDLHAIDICLYGLHTSAPCQALVILNFIP